MLFYLFFFLLSVFSFLDFLAFILFTKLDKKSKWGESCNQMGKIMYFLKLEIKFLDWLTIRFLQIFSQTFRIAEVTVLPGNSFLHCGSLRNIGLAIGILDEFLWLIPPFYLFSERRTLHKKVEDIV